jgi:anti-anti-sigma regulatory factor
VKTIKLAKEMGIKKAKKFYRAAIKVMDTESDCLLDFTRVRRIDLSIGQMVLALERECTARGLKLEIRDPNENIVRELFLAGVKCDREPGEHAEPATAGV